MTTRNGRKTPLTVGIDVGGTNIRASVVDGSGEVLDTVQAPTPHAARALEDGLARAVRELRSRHEIGAVGLAVAGFVDETRSSVRFAPHLPWEDSAVADRLTQRLGLPVILEHDANAAMWAEYRFGAAAGAHNGVLVAIGTGIGAALLVDGRLYRGSYGVAPELGHLQVVPQGRACPCGKRGCWERYCSGTALVDTAIEMLATDPMRSTILAREVFADPGSLTGRKVAGAAHDGDPVALQVMADFARWLGLGLAFVGDIFDPDLIVIAGGVSSSAALFLDDAREHYAAAVTGARHRPLARIRTTQLGEAAGMIGAAELARAALNPSASTTHRESTGVDNGPSTPRATAATAQRSGRVTGGQREVEQPGRATGGQREVEQPGRATGAQREVEQPGRATVEQREVERSGRATGGQRDAAAVSEGPGRVAGGQRDAVAVGEGSGRRADGRGEDAEEGIGSETDDREARSAGRSRAQRGGVTASQPQANSGKVTRAQANGGAGRGAGNSGGRGPGARTGTRRR